MREILTSAQLGSCVRDARLKLGMTQEELAQKAGVSSKSISTIEAGRAMGVRFDKLRPILRSLGLSIFIGEGEDEKNTKSYDELYEELVRQVLSEEGN